VRKAVTVKLSPLTLCICYRVSIFVKAAISFNNTSSLSRQSCQFNPSSSKPPVQSKTSRSPLMNTGIADSGSTNQDRDDSRLGRPKWDQNETKFHNNAGTGGCCWELMLRVSYTYMYSCRIAFLYFCLFLLILIPCFFKFRIAYFSLYTSI
jgi:hypothetical protein